MISTLMTYRSRLEKDELETTKPHGRSLMRCNIEVQLAERKGSLAKPRARRQVGEVEVPSA